MEPIQKLIAQASRELQIPSETYTRILHSSVEQTEIEHAVFKAAIETADYSNIDKNAHRLKGMFANLKVTILAETAKEIEALAKQKEGIDKIKDLFEKFNADFNELKESL